MSRSAAPPIHTEDLCVELDGARILNHVNVTIDPGEFVAILGHNGSGKTTLLRAILGLTPLCCGVLELYGQKPARFREWNRIAYVPQRLMAATSVPVSVEEAVMAARIAPSRRWSFGGRESKAAAHSALDAVGLLDRRHDRVDALSGGQSRRVMVARALASEADLLILDEPTAGVDAESELRLAETVGELHTSGKGVILVTHDLGPLAKLSTRAIVLGRSPHGSVLFDGPPPPPKHLREDVWHHSDDLDPDVASHGLMED